MPYARVRFILGAHPCQNNIFRPWHRFLACRSPAIFTAAVCAYDACEQTKPQHSVNKHKRKMKSNPFSTTLMPSLHRTFHGAPAHRTIATDHFEQDNMEFPICSLLQCGRGTCVRNRVYTWGVLFHWTQLLTLSLMRWKYDAKSTSDRHKTFPYSCGSGCHANIWTLDAKFCWVPVPAYHAWWEIVAAKHWHLPTEHSETRYHDGVFRTAHLRCAKRIRKSKSNVRFGKTAVPFKGPRSEPSELLLRVFPLQTAVSQSVGPQICPSGTKIKFLLIPPPQQQMHRSGQ